MGDLFGHVPPRPSYGDPEVIREAATKLAVHLAEWLSESGSEDELLEAMVKALMYGETDGYQICRTLESDIGIQPDSALVDIMDRAAGYESEAWARREKEWVEEYNVIADLAVGDRVIASIGTEGDVEGEVVGIDRKRGYYAVYVPSMSHVKDGPGTRARMVAFEKVRKVD